jgi:hypothetical protein
MMRNLRNKITIIVLITGLFACHSRRFPVAESKMVDILADAMVLEAGVQIKYNYSVLPDSVWTKNYGFIVKKHKVNVKDFEMTLSSYKLDGKEFAALMEKVIVKLQKDEVKHKLDKP